MYPWSLHFFSSNLKKRNKILPNIKKTCDKVI